MRTSVNLGDWLARARLKLGEASEHPGLEAQALLAHALRRQRAWVLAHPEFQLADEQRIELDALLARLCAGEPLPYLTGEQEFFGLAFHVTPDVLIPRPETEQLVERALAYLKANPGRRKAVDVGTGSGCIAVSLAHHISDLHVLAADLSWRALRVAQANALRHAAAGRVHCLASDLLEALEGPFDLICANLPYIPSRALSGLPVGRYEPALALDGGEDGLRLIRRLLGQAAGRVAEGGLVLLEIEYRQGSEAARLARRAFPAARVTILQDLSGLDRICEISL